MMTTVRIRSKHPSSVHRPALVGMARTAASDTNTAQGKATAMLPAFSDSSVRDRSQCRSQSNWADKHGTKQVIGSDAEINEAKLGLDRQQRRFETKKSPDSVMELTIKPGFGI